nr:MAG TPA: hypothetical protein [Caudoviricetes sp.]
MPCCFYIILSKFSYLRQRIKDKAFLSFWRNTLYIYLHN